MKRSLAFLLTLALTLSLAGCSAGASEDLMDGVSAQPVDTLIAGDSDAVAADFGVRLLQKDMEPGQNTLLSPLSVLYALAMTANGAQGETLAQMEAVLGLPVEELNRYLHAYKAGLKTGEKYQVNLANGIWFKEDPTFTVEPDFLQRNADYYGAGVYQAPFDAATCRDINDFVKTNTGDTIPKILDEIPEDAVMYLVNALAFDGEWQNIYKEHQIREGVFTTEEGVQRQVELMHSEEYQYLEDESATGFIKYYADRAYAFVALLPREGGSVADYVDGLTGAHLHQMLSQPENTSVYAAIPKFEAEHEADLGQVLISMGMADAFDWERADFSALGSSTEGNVVIDRVLHKTFLALDEKGTKAGAATVVEMTTESAAMAPEEPKRVILDRPFLYLLIDCENSVPLFLGTLMDVE